MRHLNILKENRGSVIIYSVLILTTIMIISFVLLSVFLPELKTSNDTVKSVLASYAADSAIEWCIYVNRDNPSPPGPPVMSNGTTYNIYYIPTNALATCSSATESPLNHRAVGTYSDVSRSFQVSTPP